MAGDHIVLGMKISTQFQPRNRKVNITTPPQPEKWPLALCMGPEIEMVWWRWELATRRLRRMRRLCPHWSKAQAEGRHHLELEMLYLSYNKSSSSFFSALRALLVSAFELKEFLLSVYSISAYLITQSIVLIIQDGTQTFKEIFVEEIA